MRWVLVFIAAVGLTVTGCPSGTCVGVCDTSDSGSSDGAASGDGSTIVTGDDGGIPYDQIGISCTVDSQGDDSCPTGLACADLGGVSECTLPVLCTTDSACGMSTDSVDGVGLQNFCLDGICFQGCDPTLSNPCGRTDFLCQPNGDTLSVCQPDCNQQEPWFCEEYQGYPNTFCNDGVGIPGYGLCTPVGQDCTDGGISECAMDQVCAPASPPAYITAPVAAQVCVSDCRGLGGPTVIPGVDAGTPDAGCTDDAGCGAPADAGCDLDAGCVGVADAGGTTTDADAAVDSGPAPDAGSDGGTGPNPEDDGDDAGTVVATDAGTSDAGVDAGPGGCTANSDCTSGACVTSDAGYGVCIPCPFGYACDVSNDSTAGSCLVQPVANYAVCSQEQQCPQSNDCISWTGGPSIGAPGGICLQTCQNDADCPSSPGPQVCQLPDPVSGGNACAIPCTLRTNCPTGTTCQAVGGDAGTAAFCLGT
jgi:hypothetical protein